MEALKRDMRSYYMRDLNRLIENLQEIPEEQLWDAPEGVTNSCGVLVQHLVGNLNHFIGEGLGQTGYVRQRDQEFTPSESSKQELIDSVEALKLTLDRVFDSVEDDSLDQPYPMELSFEATQGGFLVHLYGHLNYHLGQINYLRRMQAG
ncbi:MAG: DinB family protein [Fodinibius sp.]|nr:DinB family protein [Fodinibius sp.]